MSRSYLLCQFQNTFQKILTSLSLEDKNPENFPPPPSILSISFQTPIAKDLRQFLNLSFLSRLPVMNLCPLLAII